MHKGINYLFHCILISWVAFSEVRGQEQTEYSFSETTVKGVVVDEKGSPMPYATIAASYPSAPKIPIKGTVTSPNGTFQLQLPAGKDFLVSARFLGYRDTVCPIQTNQPVIDMGHLLLTTESHQLEQVTVKPAITMNADRIIFNFEHDKDRATSNLLKMIRKMPLIVIDDFTGKVYVESEGKTYIVLRNGKEDALFKNNAVSFDQMLEKLPAMGFTQFEIWQQPPHRFRQYDYVINILADKKQRTTGATGNLSASHDFSSGWTDVKTGIAGSSKKIRFSGDATFNRKHTPSLKTSNRTTYYASGQSPEIRITQEGKTYHNMLRYNNNLRISHDILKKQFVNIDLGYNPTKSKDGQNILIDSSSTDRNIHARHQSINHAKYPEWRLGLTYQYDFIPNSRILNLSYLFFQQSSSYDQYISKTTIGENDTDDQTSQQKDINNDNHRFQLDYTDNFSNSKLTLDAGIGYLMKKYKEQSYFYHVILQQEDENQHTDLYQDFHRIDGYAALKWIPNDQWSLTGKFNADYLPDYTKTRLIQASQTEKISQKNILYNSQFRMKYMFNTPISETKAAKLDPVMLLFLKSSIEFTYELLQRRPDPKQMSSFSDIFNSQWIKRGNPDLKPEKSHFVNVALSLAFPKFSIYPRFVFTKTPHKIMPHTFMEKNGSQYRLIESYTNSRNQDYYTSITAIYDQKISFDLNYIKYNTLLNGENSKMSNLSLRGTYKLKVFEFMRIDTELSYHRFFNAGSQGIKTSNPLGVCLRVLPKPIKIADNRLYVQVYLTDITNWKHTKSKNFTRMPDFYTETTRYKKELPITFMISYRLGKFKVQPLKSARKKAEVNGFSTE